MTAKGLEPGQLLQVMSNIDLGTKRWRRKARVIQVIGRWGTLHEIGNRRLGERTRTSPHLLIELLEELVEARIVVPVHRARGSRATAYVINPELEHWGTNSRGVQVHGGVPWDENIHAIKLWVFHDKHQDYAEPALSRAYRAPSRHKADQRREGEQHARHSSEQRREHEPYARDNQMPARGIGAALARQITPGSQEEVPPGGGGQLPSPPPEGSGGVSITDSADWRRVLAAVKAAAKAPFIEGAPKLELHELYREVGADEILGWLPEAPPEHGVPRLVAWLSDQRYRPDPELMAKLDERARAQAEAEVLASGDFGATTGGMGDQPDPPARRLEEFVAPPSHDRADPATVHEQLRAARERNGSTPTDPVDDRMTSATGGAK